MGAAATLYEAETAYFYSRIPLRRLGDFNRYDEIAIYLFR
jgi:hypothetical protein